MQKFQSDAERKLSVILEREATKWFKPAKGQFQIYYKSGADHLEYQPDFVAETEATIYMLEPKRRDEMTDADVVAKKDVAVKWCKQASDSREDLQRQAVEVSPHPARRDRGEHDARMAGGAIRDELKKPGVPARGHDQRLNSSAVVSGGLAWALHRRAVMMQQAVFSADRAGEFVFHGPTVIEKGFGVPFIADLASGLVRTSVRSVVSGSIRSSRLCGFARDSLVNAGSPSTIHPRITRMARMRTRVSWPSPFPVR